MMAVQFEEENNFNQVYNAQVRSSNASALTHWIIKQGLAKDESGANIVMIITMIICFSVAIYFAIK